MSDFVLTPSEETGQLQIMHLKRYWHKSMLRRSGKIHPGELSEEFDLDKTLLYTLGLGLEQTVTYVYSAVPGFEEFERWIINVAGLPDAGATARFNKMITGNCGTEPAAIPDVLTADDLDFWDRNGYLILRNAISKDDCEKTIAVICEFIGIDKNDPDTWYTPHPARQGIMVQLFQHPQLQKNRQSAIIKAAHEQLWGRTDLWVSADRVGFNPPETALWQFPGPRLHWDTNLEPPISFGLQGILYLADTAANQGAFSLVPGFQYRIDDWLGSLPPGTDPYSQDLYALGCVPVAANAGDFIIWHHALPHGSSANTSTKPRFVQYFTYAPAGIGE